MSEVFLKFVNMSIAAGWIVLAVSVLRIPLKKAPKWITVLLWGIVAIRLILPFSAESILSLIPSAETFSPEIIMTENPQINTGIPVLNNSLNPIISGSFSPTPEMSANPLQVLIPALSVIWIMGIVILLLYTAISYFRLRKRVATAVLLKNDIYQCETVGSPFVLGIIKPKIYLPFNISSKDEELVISHERSHIHRKDHLWKPIGFLLLTLHWFNPLIWLAYLLLCKDIEIACDERVVKEFTDEQRADYSEALLSCSVNRSMIAACPLAFGEVGVEERVKGVLNYKKPAFWVIIVAIITSVAMTVCFLTDPSSTKLKNIEDYSFFNSITESVAVYVSDGESYDLIGQVDKDLLQNLADIKISRKEISRNRGEDRDASHTLVLQTNEDAKPTIHAYLTGLYIHFNTDFTLVWVGTGVKPTLSYKVIKPEKAKEIYDNIKNYNVRAAVVSSVTDPEIIDPPGDLYRFRTAYDTAGLSLSKTDNTGNFTYSIFSSYWAVGTYEDTGNYIILKTDDGQFKYTFKKENGRLKFVADKSSDMPKYAYSPGAKAKVCVPDGAVFEKVEPEFINAIDNIVFDIDKDGKDESCVLGYGPTSGLFTFTLSVSENGKTEYFNIFHSPVFYHLRFTVLDGTLRLKGTTPDDNPKTEYFDFLFEDGNILLSSDAQNIGYWGEQGLKSPFAPASVKGLDEAVFNVLNEKYRSDKPDGLLHIESYVMLGNELISGTPQKGNDNNIEIERVYLIVYHTKYSVGGKKFVEENVWNFVPTVITFSFDEKGNYSLNDYWTPENDKNYEENIKKHFPEGMWADVSNTEKYKEALIDNSRKQVDAYLESRK